MKPPLPRSTELGGGRLWYARGFGFLAFWIKRVLQGFSIPQRCFEFQVINLAMLELQGF